MGSIATSVDSSLLRVGVSLSGWAADGPVTVNRVHVDGQRYPVRGMSAVSGGVAFGWDYETPLSAEFTYEAEDATLVTSATVTLPVGFDVATLSAPGLPSFSAVINPTEKPAFAIPRPSVSLDIFGRVDPITTMDVMKAPAFSLTVRTYTHADGYALLSLLGVAPVMLLRMPGTFLTDWCYVTVASSAPKPQSPYKSGQAAEWYEWDLACQVEGTPVGGVYGDPTSTWQALRDTGMTWQDLRDTGKTWLDVLRGVGSV